MNEQIKNLLTQLMELPEMDRALVAERLLTTLTPASEDVSPEEIGSELDERLEDYQRNPAGGMPWAELRDE